MIEDLRFEFSYNTKPTQSFRVKSLMGQYDLEDKEVIQTFKGNYSLPKKWNVGLIVGNSGSGKTSICKNVFGDFTNLEWDKNPIIDNFSDHLSMEEITFALGSVGFNSVPFWLKSYHVLSNGEKSRADLARLSLENELVCYDEFTSLVDRDVAKSTSNSVQKLFRKLNKKFVAVTCHHDVLEWLNPDWVYNTDTKVFCLPKLQGAKGSNLTSQKSVSPVGNIIGSIII
jgi:ABC-type ATPase with predicted acetyltransferase domain